MSPTLAIVSTAQPLSLITRGDIPEDVRRRIDPVAAHQLQMAEALERVIAEVPIPSPLDGTMGILNTLLDQAIMARLAANAMAAPSLHRRRPVHPGEAFGAAENAAQFAYQAYKVQLADGWPVTQWQDALRAIAVASSQEGAWELLAIVGDGLRGDAGSIEWWDAVVHVSGLWGDRHLSREAAIAG